MNPTTIRSATPSDESALGRFGAALMRLHHQADPQRFILTSNPEAGYGRFLVSQLGDAECVVLVADRAGEAVGYAYASLEPTSWKELRAACGYLHDVYVDEAARHAGVGEALVRAVLDWLAAKKAPRVVLTTKTGNAAAQALFERLGFRRTMVEMTRELGSG